MNDSILPSLERRKKKAPLMEDVIGSVIRSEMNILLRSGQKIHLTNSPSKIGSTKSSGIFSLGKDFKLIEEKGNDDQFDDLDPIEKNAILGLRKEIIKDYLNDIIGLNRNKGMQVDQIEKKMEEGCLKCESHVTHPDDKKPGTIGFLLDLFKSSKESDSMLNTLLLKTRKTNFERRNIARFHSAIEKQSPFLINKTGFHTTIAAEKNKKVTNSSLKKCESLSGKKCQENKSININKNTRVENDNKLTFDTKSIGSHIGDKTDTESFFTVISNNPFIEEERSGKRKKTNASTTKGAKKQSESIEKKCNNDISQLTPEASREKEQNNDEGLKSEFTSHFNQLKTIEPKVSLTKKATRYQQVREETYRRLTEKNCGKVFDSLSDNEDLIQDFSGLIHPKSELKENWDKIITLVLIYSLIFVPVFLAMCLKDHWMITTIDFLCDVTYSIDVILQFYIPFQNVSTDNYEISMKDIALNYMLRWFIVDFVAGLPLNSIINFLDFHEGYLLLKLIRLVKLIKLIRDTEKKESVWENYILTSSMRRLVFFIMSFLVLNHVLACIWIFLATLESPNWVMRNNLQNDAFIDVYISALYFNIATIYTIGYGDVIPVSYSEKIYNILLELIGVFLYSFTLSNLVSLMRKSDREIKLEQALLLLENMRMQYKNLNGVLYHKIKRFLTYEHNTNKKDRFEMLKDFPNSLKNELVNHMYQDIIKKFKFFKHTNLEFNTKVITYLRPFQSIHNDILIYNGETIDELLFVKRGILSLEIIYRDNLIKLSELMMGEHFGEIYMLLNKVCEFDIVVKSKIAELYLLEKEHLIEICMEFPDIFNNIQKSSQINMLLFAQKMKKKKMEINKLIMRRQASAFICDSESTSAMKEFDFDEGISPIARNDNIEKIYCSQDVIKEESEFELEEESEKSEKIKNDSKLSFKSASKHSIEGKTKEIQIPQQYQISLKVLTPENDEKKMISGSEYHTSPKKLSVKSNPELKKTRTNLRKFTFKDITPISNFQLEDDTFNEAKQLYPHSSTLAEEGINLKKIAKTGKPLFSPVSKKKVISCEAVKTNFPSRLVSTKKVQRHTLLVNQNIQDGSLNMNNPKMFYSSVFEKWNLDNQIFRIDKIMRQIFGMGESESRIEEDI